MRLHQRPHPARRGVHPQQQLVEREPAVHRDDDLAVEHEARGAERPRGTRPRRGSTGPAACPPCSGAAPCRRRGTRGSGSRPTWARTATRGRRAASAALSASIGAIGEARAAGSQQPPPAGTGRAAASSGFHRSPSLRTRAGTLSIRKSSISKPRSTSCQVTGVETVARSASAAPSRSTRACVPRRSGCSPPAPARAAAWRSGTRP